MAPWKKAFHVPGNLIKHRIARLLGQFTGGCLDRIIRGPLSDKGQMDRFTRLGLLSTTPYEIAGNPLTRGSRIIDHRFHRRRGIDSLLEARVLAYERIIIASFSIFRGENCSS